MWTPLGQGAREPSKLRYFSGKRTPGLEQVSALLTRWAASPMGMHSAARCQGLLTAGKPNWTAPPARDSACSRRGLGAHCGRLRGDGGAFQVQETKENINTWRKES